MRVLPALLALALAALLLLAPAASAQGHDHGGLGSGIAIAHDVPADGRIYAGDIGRFAALVLGDDLVPDFHQQMHLRVTWNGLVLFETTPDSGHDYDGVNAFDVVFPGPGPYEVAVLDGSGKVLEAFRGTVVAPNAGSGAGLVLEGPAEASPGFPAEYVFFTKDADGIVPHSDALFEVRQGSTVLFRTKTHTHDERQRVLYTFQQPGDYTVRVTNYQAYPSDPDGNDFAPSVEEMSVRVRPGLFVAPSTDPTPPPADMNAVVHGTTNGGDYVLVGTYDPYTTVGTQTLQHLNALVLDPATGQPVQHVDFTAALTGPIGTVFASHTLHEYDGLLEVTAQPTLPGLYRLDVEASRGDWSGRLQLAFAAAPSVVPVATDVPPQAAGPVAITAAGLDGIAAGVPASIKLSARNAAGQPFPHSEIDAQVLGSDGVPVLATKLHTHSDGDFAFTATLPREGDYVLRLSPFALDPAFTPLFTRGDGGSGLDFAFRAAAGEALPTDSSPALVDTQAQGAPALAAPMVLLGLAALAGVARRRA